jgi:predicted dehydrogenase
MVGCGWGASALYAPFFRYLENGELIAVMDVDEQRARTMQQRTGAARAPRLYSNLGMNSTWIPCASRYWQTDCCHSL